MDFRSRIVGYGDEPLDNILFNPNNWRVHPKAQQEAMTGVLSEIGWVEGVIINVKTGNLIDGHMRALLAQKAGSKTIPAIYVDLTLDEENLILATKDPIGMMAVADQQKFSDLCEVITTDNQAVEDLIKAMGEMDGIPEKSLDPKPGRTKKPKIVICPGCGMEIKPA